MELTFKRLLKDEIEYLEEEEAIELINYYNQDILRRFAEVVQNSTNDIEDLLDNDLSLYFALFNGNTNYSGRDKFIIRDDEGITSTDNILDAIIDLDEFLDYIIDHEEDFECWINFDYIKSFFEDEEEEEEEEDEDE